VHPNQFDGTLPGPVEKPPGERVEDPATAAAPVLHDRGSVATIDGHPIVLATPRAKEPVRRKPRKQLGVTSLLLRRFGLWVIDGPSPTGTTRWNSQVGRLRWSSAEFAGYTRYRHGEYWLPENDRGRSAGSAFEPERSRGTLGATPARSVP